MKKFSNYTNRLFKYNIYLRRIKLHNHINIQLQIIKKPQSQPRHLINANRPRGLLFTARLKGYKLECTTGAVPHFLKGSQESLLIKRRRAENKPRCATNTHTHKTIHIYNS